MSSCEKKHCPSCKNSKVHRYGKSRHGKQRWFCSICKKTYSWANSENKNLRRQVWFRKWIVEGYSLRQLSTQSGYSISTLQRINHYWLNRIPSRTLDCSSYRYLIFDGTMVEQRRGPYAVMTAQGNRVFYSEPHISEGPSDLQKFCFYLWKCGLSPRSATVDGNRHLLRVLRMFWPEILIQRCLVHIQRQGLMWCRHQPKRTDAKHLRSLFVQVMSIHRLNQRAQFLDDVQRWEYRYGTRIALNPETGWVFSDLKRARSMLLTALPDMFHYLQDPIIPRSTNALEGYFSRLKQKYRQHRGIAKHHRLSYFSWYSRLCPR